MAYTSSKAGIGLGTALSINTGTVATPVWTPVLELKSVAQSGRQVATEDVTNFSSTAREFVPTLLDSGTWDLSGNRVGSDAGQLAMETAFQGLSITMFKVVLPKAAGQTTSGDTFQFSALVQECNYSVNVDKAVSVTAKLKVSGSITLTAGS